MTLTWAKNGEVTGLDPQVAGQQVTWDILFRVYETLVKVRDDGAITPLLATSWERVSPVEYVFQLRPNARFSNGRRMTSADVVTSFERVLDPKLASYALPLLDVIKSVEAEGTHAVRFRLKEPSGTFLTALGGIAASILPGKELNAKTFDPAKELLGTGPYQVEEHRQNESWTFVRNPHYWREGYPRFGKLVVLIVDDPTARLAALRSGRADVVTSEEPDTPELVEGTPNVSVVPQDTTLFYALDLNAVAKSSQVKDQIVRQAIAMALDREQIIEIGLGGVGQVVAGAGTVSGLPDACETSELATPNVDEATSLVADANATGREISIKLTNAYPNVGRIAQVVQSQLEEIGLEPEISSMEQGAWLEDVYTKGDFDVNVTFYGAHGDNWSALRNWSPSAAAYTEIFQLGNPAYDRLLKESATLQPGTERAEVFQRMCEVAAEQANIIPLATRTNFVAYRTDRVAPAIQEFEPNMDTMTDIAEFSPPAP